MCSNALASFAVSQLKKTLLRFLARTPVNRHDNTSGSVQTSRVIYPATAMDTSYWMSQLLESWTVLKIIELQEFQRNQAWLVTQQLLQLTTFRYCWGNHACLPFDLIWWNLIKQWNTATFVHVSLRSKKHLFCFSSFQKSKITLGEKNAIPGIEVSLHPNGSGKKRCLVSLTSL